jgi:hypothetical protein
LKFQLHFIYINIIIASGMEMEICKGIKWCSCATIGGGMLLKFSEYRKQFGKSNYFDGCRIIIEKWKKNLNN